MSKTNSKNAVTAAKTTETVASFMRRLITEGKSNEEVFKAASKKFGIGEEKKTYPSWYRSEMKRTAAKAKKAAAKKTAKKVSAKA